MDIKRITSVFLLVILHALCVQMVTTKVDPSVKTVFAGI
jgi:hypothetical protein